MPFGTEVGLGPGDIVLDGDPAPPREGAQHPPFDPCLLWPNGRPSQQLLSCYLPVTLSRQVPVSGRQARIQC